MRDHEHTRYERRFREMSARCYELQNKIEHIVDILHRKEMITEIEAELLKEEHL